MRANVPIPKHVPCWWLSFLDPAKPDGEQFLGAVVTRGADCEGAANAAAKVEDSPVYGCELGCDCHANLEIAYQELGESEEWRVETMLDRWMPREEVLAMETQEMFPDREADHWSELEA